MSLGSQSTGNVSHRAGARLPLLPVRHHCSWSSVGSGVDPCL